MKSEITILPEKKKDFERRLGCVFREDGEFAEMSLDLSGYEEKTSPLDGVCFAMYNGDPAKLRAAVAQVDEEWVQYYDGSSPAFCAFVDGEPVSFCLIDTDADCLISADGIRVGSVGCVGTLPRFRRRGIGLRMVDLATVQLRRAGCGISYIHYTAVGDWYAKLGYRTFARFSFR